MKYLLKPIDYFCILAGGGVRGTAYIGVLKMLEEANINISGMAGSSVGAIFSALHLVGYSSEELKKLLLSTNYEQFRDLYLPFGKDFGICKGDNFLKWFKHKVESKFYGAAYKEGKNPPVTFKDFDKDLVVIATDICTTSVKEFSKHLTPDTEIAQAVRASISIPGFFRPIWDEKSCLVDGDIIKNLPMWTFSKNIMEHKDRILEIRLESAQETKKINNPYDYFNAVIDTASNISTEFVIDLYGDNDRFDFVKIDTKHVGIIDFAISDRDKKWLIDEGYKITKEHFKKGLYKKRKQLKSAYKNILTHLEELEFLTERNKVKEAKAQLGEIALVMIKNRSLINTSIYKGLIALKELYLDSIKPGSLIISERFKDREKIIYSLRQNIDQIEKLYSESQNYLMNLRKI